MQASRKYLVIILFCFITVLYKLWLYSSSIEIAQLTDYATYQSIFKGDSEDVGFYPVFIAIKNIFVYFSIPFSIFQIGVSSLYTISICIFIVLSLSSLKIRNKSIILISIAIAIAYSLFSYSSLKAFSLVKFYLSISILGFSCLTIRPKYIELASPSIFNLALALFASPQTSPALLLYLNQSLGKFFLQFVAIVSNLGFKMPSLSNAKLLNAIFCTSLILILFGLLALSPLIKDSDNSVPLILITTFFDKFNAYLPAHFIQQAFYLLPLLFFSLILLFLCFRRNSFFLFLPSISLLIIVLFGTNRFSPLVPFFLFTLLRRRPLVCVCLLDLFLIYETIKGTSLLA